MVSRLSSAKSPQQMFGAVAKTYFAEKIGVPPERIHTLSVMPCIAKKAEAEMELFYGEYAGNDVDTVITTREFLNMMRAESLQVEYLEDRAFDPILGEKTGAGMIFGVTGGVMEAALRTAYATIMGKNPSPEEFALVRNSTTEVDGVRSSQLQIGEHTVRIAVVSGLGNARKLLEKIDAGQEKYHFVEVMACPGGCVGGGGQPIHEGEERAVPRGAHLYALDHGANLRFSHENKDVQALYDEFLEKPCSTKAHHLLHTK